MLKRLLSSLWVAATAFSVVAAPVLAQDYYVVRKKDNGVLQWSVFLGILILLCIGGFMNPKRSHQD